MTEQTEITKQTEHSRERSDFLSSVQFILSVSSSALLIVLLLIVPAQAQRGKKATQTKKATTGKTQSIALPGAQQCDGALEVVPRTQLTFIRKRRPATPPSGTQ
jgi:hypothetical protein